MYAQKLEGDAWIGERMNTTKIDKMSGLFARLACSFALY
jgi:hypothetical protein